MQPALVIGAKHGGGAPNKALADALRAQHKGRVSSVTLPRRVERAAFQGPTVPNRGKLASEVSEDRR